MSTQLRKFTRSFTSARSVTTSGMADFLKLGSSTSPTGPYTSGYTDVSLLVSSDMEARKETFKQSLRSELALANAQQLINVRPSRTSSNAR